MSLGTSAALSKPLWALSEPLFGVCGAAPALGVCLGLRLGQQGRAGGKALPPLVCAKGWSLLTSGDCSSSRLHQSGEKYYPKVLRSSFLRELRLLVFAGAPSHRYVSLKAGGAPAAGLEDPRHRQTPRSSAGTGQVGEHCWQSWALQDKELPGHSQAAVPGPCSRLL